LDISIVVPIYNEQDNVNALYSAITGAMRQMRCDYELIMVDDGSSDGSYGLLAELAKVGFDPVFGARPLKRAIQQRIENPLSRQILEGRFAPKSTISVDVDPIQAPGQFQFALVAP